MAMDIFLKLEGVKGESQDATHKDEIHIESMSFGASQGGAAFGAGSGLGTGKVNINDIKISKVVDAASPTLFLFCCNGKHIKSGLITVRKAGDKPLEYLKIKLEDIIVTEYGGNGAGSGDLVTESVNLNFSKIWMEYQKQKEDGSGEPAGDMGFDIKGNCKL